jgi:hypothetical protein
MRERPYPTPPAEEPRPSPSDWMSELRHILFDGAGPSESRLEHFLDRLERRA